MKRIARSAIVEHGACAMYALVERIDFTMEYEFAGAVVSRALGPVFEAIADTMVDAFKCRADTVYGQVAR